MCPDLFWVTSKISSLARGGRILYARRLFDRLPNRDRVCWNAMISAYCQLGLPRESLSLLGSMRAADIRPDHFTFTSCLNACARSGDVLFGGHVHALVVVSGYGGHVAVSNALIDMYGKCSRPDSAEKVFEETVGRNDISYCSLLFAYMRTGLFAEADVFFTSWCGDIQIAWNVMIAGYAECDEVESCIQLFNKMNESPCEPDQWTLSSLMDVSAESSEMVYGRAVHAFVIKSGWGSADESRNSILGFYSKHRKHDALKLLESFGARTLVSWNVMIDSYMKVGDVHNALLAFKQAPERNVNLWTAVTIGYSQNGFPEQALSFFVDMIRNSLRPDDVSFVAALHACSSLAVLSHGQMIHGNVIRCGFHMAVCVGNGLTNMYAKCGHLEWSCRMFADIPRKDVVSWNAMLFGLGLHGHGLQAMKHFEEMLACGIKPDKASFISLLMTCSHSGLVEEGRAIFNAMETEYGVKQEEEHVKCMVDMLGRNGFLEEARDLAIEHGGAGLQEALLGACSVHGEMAIGKEIGEDLRLMEPWKDISYVALSNLYCVSGKWKEAEMVRKMMRSQGVRKKPGCSWVQVRDAVTSFFAGQNTHPFISDGHELLSFLHVEMRAKQWNQSL
ncbi:hypothetical protein MLD38_038868 [Melastoma candidum]|uniref:Uncharacterized protein n=1 Tax=Melastoma candidum TaxID=119954 RepID=A0ACB9L1A3_9MYRT|nr:hypothetical protein MLD38_038868 [Melastoma candidum]